MASVTELLGRLKAPLTYKLVEVTLVKFPLPVTKVKLALVEVIEVRLALPVSEEKLAFVEVILVRLAFPVMLTRLLIPLTYKLVEVALARVVEPKTFKVPEAETLPEESTVNLWATSKAPTDWWCQYPHSHLTKFE